MSRSPNTTDVLLCSERMGCGDNGSSDAMSALNFRVREAVRLPCWPRQLRRLEADSSSASANRSSARASNRMPSPGESSAVATYRSAITACGAASDHRVPPRVGGEREREQIRSASPSVYVHCMKAIIAVVSS